MPATVTPGPARPREELAAALGAEGLEPHAWSNGPGDRYAPHAHPYHKVLYCIRGSITFTLGDGTALALEAGGRLDLPAGTLHGAVAGPSGVECIEAARPA